MPEYVIYRKSNGRLDCIPRESSLYPGDENVIEIVRDTCISAWSRLKKLEREEKNAKNH